MTDKSTVLIIDDSALLRTSLGDILTGHGFEVQTAKSGKEGLALIQTAPPDVVLMDVVMPVMDGWETCRQIRATAFLQSVPIIIMTSKNTPQDLLRSFEVGANEFLEKPIGTQELLDAIDAAIRRRMDGAAGAR